MNFGRILANAVARRIAVVIVAAALAWLGLSEARAHTPYPCDQPADNCTISQAYAAASNPANHLAHCKAINATHSADPFPVDRWGNNNGWRAQIMCRRSDGQPASGNGSYEYYYFTSGCPSGQEWNAFLGQCKTTCSSRPPSVANYSAMIPSGSVACVDGCEAMVSPNGDGSYTRTFIGGSGSHCGVLPNDCSQNGPGYVMNALTGMCQPKPAECKENEVKDPVTGVCEQGCPTGMVMDSTGICKPKENDCPAGNVRAPSGQCLPGDGQCAAGEARRKDGTCGRDANGDGVADIDDNDESNDDQKETFSGGDSCSSPPSCSGGPIMCGQARIQWRIDCNTRRNVNISGGACSSMPVCTGEKCNAMEYASLLQQWRATCALEKLASRDGGEGEGGQPEWTKVTGDGTGGAGEDPDKPLRKVSLGLGMLDAGGFLGGGSCPQFGTVDLGIFGSVNLDDYGWICDLLAAVKVVFTGLGAFIGFCIISGWRPF